MYQQDQSAITVDEVQRLSPEEAMALSRLWLAGEHDHYKTPDDRADALRRQVSKGGRLWIVRRGKQVAGYASLMPAPGLPGLYELDGDIAPAQRGQGLATVFMRTIIQRLAGGEVRQLSYPVPSMEAPAASFLQENGFTLEHEERQMILQDFSALPAVNLDPGYSLRIMAQKPAITHFRLLYEASFVGLAWYQPYEDDREVAQDLEDVGNLLFLAEGDQPIGFLWLRWPQLQLAEIEPVGILPAYRGRGLGRQLVAAGLKQAAQQGATCARVGFWQTNAVARTLYRQLGFQPAGRTFYLAYDLP